MHQEPVERGVEFVLIAPAYYGLYQDQAFGRYESEFLY
jgi:hypothetical protein